MFPDISNKNKIRSMNIKVKTDFFIGKIYFRKLTSILKKKKNLLKSSGILLPLRMVTSGNFDGNSLDYKGINIFIY